MYQERATTGALVTYLRSVGGYTTKSTTVLADLFEVPVRTMRHAIFRLQREGVLSLRDEDNKLSVLTGA